MSYYYYPIMRKFEAGVPVDRIEPDFAASKKTDVEEKIARYLSHFRTQKNKITLVRIIRLQAQSKYYYWIHGRPVFIIRNKIRYV